MSANWTDKVVSYFSPQAGFRRAQARMKLDGLRAYDAAAKGDRLKGWKTKSTSANAEIAPSISIMRDRMRALVRNHAYTNNAVSILEDYIVGTGIMGSIETSRARALSKMSKHWMAWSESSDASVDGLNNFYGLQGLAVRSWKESGEALAVRRWRKLSDGYRIPVPFQVQVLEGDYIDSLKEGRLTNGNFIVQGIEFNERGQRVAYWLYREHPGEISMGRPLSLGSERIDAKDVIHLFGVTRPGQIRGISDGAVNVIGSHDLDEFEDAELVRQKIAALYAGYIRDIDSENYAGAAGPTQNQEQRNIVAGSIEVLPDGKTIEFPNLPAASNDGFTARKLRSIAAGWGLPYEMLTGDWSNVNYSSAKMGMNKFKRRIEKQQWNIVIPRFNARVFQWFQEAAMLADVSRGDAESAKMIWTPPRFELIDPTKEIPALIRGVRGGVISLPQAVRETGVEFLDHLNEIAEGNKAIDKLELILDSDPRKTTQAGMLQAVASQQEEEETETDPPPPAKEEEETDSSDSVSESDDSAESTEAQE